MKLITMANPNGTNVQINPVQITHIESLGSEQFKVHFVGGGWVVVASTTGSTINDLLSRIEIL
jgi:hypothetical protein